jgi:cytosine/adenosine deaminase-related metal-dependent hydrolase
VRRFSSDWIFTLAGPPLKNGVVQTNEEGVVTGIMDQRDLLDTSAGTEFYSGIIVPGFVNCHCHLELSHLKEKITGLRGIGEFIGEISRKRTVPEEEITIAAAMADTEMFSEGTAGVGDVSNTGLALDIKKNSKISYFTFVEVFGFHPSRAKKATITALSIFESYRSALLPASIVPHSAYSVSDLLFEKIGSLSVDASSILSVHNQESEDEERFFSTGDGPILKHLVQNLEIDVSHWQPSPGGPLLSIIKKLPAGKPLLLVHNTFTAPKDLSTLKQYRKTDNTYLVLCPNSNLHISSHLPPLSLFRSENFPICIGTDSLASNSRLSVLSELITLQKHFPETTTRELFEWACRNGAEAIGMKKQLGTIEPGKKPGLVLISGFNLRNMRLTPESKAIRLI